MSVKRYAAHTNIDDFKSDWHESKDGPMVRHEDYDALEARCAALAAENAGLKEWSPNPHSASMFEAIEKAEALMDDGMPELAMIEAFEILKMKRTPATDAFLAEVRAQGVEMFAAHKRERQQALSSRSMRMSEEAAGMAADAENFADELRKGVQS
nr:MAG TPA: hypothetical protein [Caudoviricetes sp.]